MMAECENGEDEKSEKCIHFLIFCKCDKITKPQNHGFCNSKTNLLVVILKKDAKMNDKLTVFIN
jgi:hypothetical protein